MNKILIIRLSSIGDIILTTPLIRAVRKKYPDAQIDFVVKDVFADVLQTNPHLATIFEFSKKKDNLKEIKVAIKNNQYDLIIDVHKNFRSRYLCWNSGSKKVVRHQKHIFKRTLLVKWKINLFRTIIPTMERYFKSVASLGISYDNLGTEMPISPTENQNAKQLLFENGKKEQQLFIALCPGASFNNKRWTPEGFYEVANHFIQEKKAFIGFLGGKEDVELCNKIGEKLPQGSYQNFAGKCSILGSAALTQQADLVITNDTGLMHIAQTQKKPVVAIFGPTTKELGFFPMPEKSIVVEYPASCRPCTHTGMNHCPKKHFKCMNEISAQEVISAANSLI